MKLIHLDDVNINPNLGEDGKFIKYDFLQNKFILDTVSSQLRDLTDTNFGNSFPLPNDDKKVMRYDIISDKFVLDNLGLGDLSGVFINEPPQIGQVLAYGGNNRFENFTIDISTQQPIIDLDN